MIRFSEIQQIENSAFKDSGISLIEREAIKSYEEFEQKKKTAKEIPFEYFYEDVISSSLQINFKSIIGEPTYKNAGKDALACLEIAMEIRKLSPHSMPSWIQGALKFIDYIVLHYIQEYHGDIPKKYNNAGIEKSRYCQLSDYSDSEIRVAGNELINLYEMRNSFEHRTITHKDGTQELIKPRYGRLRKEGVKLYSNALSRVLKEYMLIYPEHHII
jgi:hypothetical protein